MTVRLSQPLLVLAPEDRIHGFKMPDYVLRTDSVPSHETRVSLTPGRTGTFTFIYDIFCGDGHDEMDGVLAIEA